MEEGFQNRIKIRANKEGNIIEAQKGAVLAIDRVKENTDVSRLNPQNAGDTEKIEKIEKILRLYKKAIFSKEFETADQLDTSGISQEDLKKVRVGAYTHLLQEVKEDCLEKRWSLLSFNEIMQAMARIQNNIHIEPSETIDTNNEFINSFVIKQIDRMFEEDRDNSDDIKEWAKENNFGKEKIKEEISSGYSRYQKFLITESDRLFKYAHEKHNSRDSWSNSEKDFKQNIAKAENYKINLPLQNSTSLEKISNEVGINYTPEEKKGLQEAGFIAVLEVKAPYSYNSKEEIDLALKVSNLTKESLSSEYVEKRIVDKFISSVKNISLKKGSNEYNPYSLTEYYKSVKEIECLSPSILFPKDFSRHPEAQNIIDSKFVEMIDQLKIDNGALVPSEFLKQKMEGEHVKSNDIEANLYQHIANLVTLAKSMKVSKEALTSSDLTPLVSNYIEKYFNDIKQENIHYFSLDREVIDKLGVTSEQLNSKAEICFLATLKTPDSKSLNKIADILGNFKFSEQFNKSTEVVTVEMNFLKNLIDSKAVLETTSFLRLIDLPKDVTDSPQFVDLKQKTVFNGLSAGLKSINSLEFIVEKFGLDNIQEFLKSEQVQEKAKELTNKHITPMFNKILQELYRNSSSDYAMSRFDNEKGDLVYHNTDYSWSKPPDGMYEFIKTINILTKLNSGDLIKNGFSKEMSEAFGLPNQNIELLHYLYRQSDKLVLFGINEELLQKIIVDSLIRGIGKATYTESKDPNLYNSGGTWLFAPNAEYLAKIEAEYKLDEEETHRLALASFNYFLATYIKKHGSNSTISYEEHAKNIFDKYKLTSLETSEVAKELYYMYIAKGWTEWALKTKKNFNLEIDSAELDVAIQKTFIEGLKNGNFQVEQLDGLTSDFLKTDQVQELGRRLFFKQLSEGRDDDARTTKSLLLLDINVEDIVKENSDAKIFIDKIQEKFPNLAKKYLNSVDAFISIYSQIGNENIFKTLEEYPFLSDALMNNEQYGLKLLFKFDSLDNLSKANIEILYKNREYILKKNPSIDVESRDFRIAMQDLLGEYRKNPEITTAMQRSGINVEEWLNHEDEIYFELGKDKALKFSDTITTPIERIQETINHYSKTVKNILDQFKKELAAFMVNFDDPVQLKSELEALQVQKQIAEQGGNVKKAEGIARGIVNLEGRIASPKNQSLWNKIIGQLLIMDLAKKDVFKAYNSLREIEVKIAEQGADSSIPQDKKRKEFLKSKAEVENLKIELKEKFVLLENRMDKLQNGLRSLISPALGEERTLSLIQEIQEKVVENMDHYDSDRTTLANLFAEKKEEGFDSQPMKINVWSRNPDKDLYLGNYTDCCIRIDSEHMGAESTIADYLTDVGVQIVTISDEKKNIPIAAAWCWIGHDNNDQIALVVDNIEANTQYSAKYKNQLENKIKEYIENYAKKVGIKVVQGTSNNDLVIAKMDSTYFKLGGYNRASGYYLEAEDSQVNGGEVDDGENENW